MEIDINKEAVRSFLGRAKDKEGKEYKIKVIAFKEVVTRTEHYGDIRSVAFIEGDNGEIIRPMLFPSELTDEQVLNQGEHMVKNIDAILEQ